MRIAMFSNTLAPVVGGIEKSVATFSADLRERGHEVRVITTTPADEPASADEPAAANEPRVLRVPWSVGTDAAIAAALDAFAPEVIHTHQPFLLGATAAREAKRLGLPLVHTHHTLYDRVDDRHALAAFADLEKGASALAIAHSNRSEAVIAPTGSIAEILREQGVRGTIDIVPTGIDPALFTSGDGKAFRLRHGIPAKAFVVGHLGRLIPAKRAVHLAAAIAAFLTKQPNAIALVCGEGESAACVREEFVRAGVADRLVLLGLLDPESLADAYAAMDLFAFASLTDTQGLVLLEAMAAGLPVLAHHATGPGDLVVDGVCGRLLPPEASAFEFGEAIAEFLDPAKRAAWSVAARGRAAAYDRRRCAESLESVYHEAIRRGPLPYPEEILLAELQQEVQEQWRKAVAFNHEMRALMPTRGFPDCI